MGLFGKKICSVCSNEIKFLGNRKLEDGNLCKDCASKLSPFFSDRRKSTVEHIKEQLAYREANKDKVAQFHATTVFGDSTKVVIDEDAGKFMIANTRDYASENPDVIDFSDVTGVDIDIDESCDEKEREAKDGRMVSYNPPRYFYSYEFNVVIHVNNPYFDTIRVQVNDSDVELNPGHAVPAENKPNPRANVDYCEYERMCKDIKSALTSGRNQAREQAAAANAPRIPVVCQCCGATTLPDQNGCCEYCGGLAQG